MVERVVKVVVVAQWGVVDNVLGFDILLEDHKCVVGIVVFVAQWGVVVAIVVEIVVNITNMNPT